MKRVHIRTTLDLPVSGEVGVKFLGLIEWLELEVWDHLSLVLVS